MKVKVVEITGTDAKFKMLRNEMYAWLLMVIGLLLFMASIVMSPTDITIILSKAMSLIALVVGLAILCVSSSNKSNLQKLNMISSGRYKYVLKEEAKDE